MAKKKPKREPSRFGWVWILVLIAVPSGLFAWWHSDPGRERSPCELGNYVASPGYFSNGWCVQRPVTTKTIDQEGREYEETTWVGDECFESEAEARAFCAKPLGEARERGSVR